MVKPSSNRQRFQPFRASNRVKKNTHEVAVVKVRVLKRVDGPKSAPSDATFFALSRALKDQKSPYEALILKSVSPSAYHELKSVVAGLSQGATYAARIDADLEDEALEKKLRDIQKDVARIGKSTTSTLMLYWDGESAQGNAQMGGLAALLGGAPPPEEGGDSAEDAGWSDSVASFVKAAHAAAPRMKIVVVTPRTALDDGEALDKCEVQDVNAYASNLDSAGRLSKAEQLALANKLAIAPASLKAALIDVPYTDIKNVLQHAGVLHNRWQQDGIPELKAAVAAYWQRSPTDADDLLKRFMWDTTGAGFDKTFFDVPQKVQTFVQAVKNSQAFGRVNATMPDILALDAGHVSGTASLAQAIAGELNGICIRIEDVELASLLADERGPGLPGVLDAANSLGRERNCRVVVYLGALDALLALGVKNMRAMGKEPGFEHLVIVTASDNLEEDMRTRLQPYVHLSGLPVPKQEALQKFWKHYLDLEHPAHTLDNDAVARVARASAGFHVKEVQHALVQAGNLAFSRENGQDQPTITEADVINACRQASDARKHVMPYLVPTSGAGLAGASNVPPAVYGFVELLKNFEEAKQLDRGASKSLLLYGKRGAGKLAVAKGIADEIGASVFALTKNEVIGALGDEEVGLLGLLRKVNTFAQQQDRNAVVYLGDLESALSAGFSAEEQVGFNPVFAQIAKLASDSGNEPDLNRLVLVAGTNDERIAENPSMLEAFQAATEVRSPKGEALTDLYRQMLATQHPANDIDDEALARIVTASSHIDGFNAGSVTRVLHNASRLAWQRPSEGPRRLQVQDVLRGIEELSRGQLRPSFYT